MLFYSKRSCALPTLKMHYVYKSKGKLVRWFLWQEQRWAHGWPPRNEGSVPKSQIMNARHGHFGRVFFFACVHHVGLAYISSDLRTCTQRMFARNISGACKWVKAFAGRIETHRNWFHCLEPISMCLHAAWKGFDVIAWKLSGIWKSRSSCSQADIQRETVIDKPRVKKKGQQWYPAESS